MRLGSVFKMRMNILNTATTEQMGYGILSFFWLFQVHSWWEWEFSRRLWIIGELKSKGLTFKLLYVIELYLIFFSLLYLPYNSAKSSITVAV